MPAQRLLLPGLLCDRAVWQAQIDALGPCHVVDYGALDSLRGMAEHALATAPPGPLAVAGHSMGGRVAFEMWRMAPDRIERLALLDTSYHPQAEGAAGDSERAGRLALLDTARRDGMRTMAREWALGMVHPSRHHTALFEAVLDMLARKTPAIFAAQINALLNRPDCSELLATIRCPTLLLCGREDNWSAPARHEHMHGAIAGSQLVVVETCGHMSTMEQPVAVNQALLEWLG
ncbi:MAG: alpha/beta hydrolase [Cytophagales bacterium]|nr:alpha/beta hydrolase [Rhizobacter sp.]